MPSISHPDNEAAATSTSDKGAQIRSWIDGRMKPPPAKRKPAKPSATAKRKRAAKRGPYYAVRVGHFAAMGDGSAIRSAIFFHWEDAQRFVSSVPPERGAAEWAVLDSIEQAEDYLIEGERRARLGVKPKAKKKASPEAKARRADATIARLEGEKRAGAANASASTDGARENARANQRQEGMMPACPALPPWDPESTIADVMQGKSPGRSDASKNAHVARLAGTKRDAMEIAYDGASGDDSDSEASSREIGTKGPSKSDIKWDKMYNEVLKYRQADGSIDIPKVEDGVENGDVDRLRRWYKWHITQARNHPGSVSTERLERLKEIGFHAAPSWDAMYDKLVAHKVETGKLNVNRTDDSELHDWIKEQKRMLLGHFQGKDVDLSNERLNKLKSLGFAESRPGMVRTSGIVDSVALETKWNAMFEDLKGYKERNNGKMSFPHQKDALSERDKALKYWVTEQRRQFRRMQKGESSNLTAIRLQRLTDVGFNFKPITDQKSWEERMESLRAFKAEHGHCKPPMTHELGVYVSLLRKRYKEREEGKANVLTDERVNELLELGFVFHAGPTPKATPKKSWDDRFQELLDFKEAHGHTVVPQNSGPLGNWVRMQRLAYKKLKRGEAGRKSMTTERALRLSEIGFCFDASDRFKKKGDKEKNL